jgi:TonB family protein
MNCQEFAAVLDEKRLSDLPQNTSSALAAHAAVCHACAEAFAASEALARDPIPAPPAAVDVAGLLRRHAAGGRAARPLLRRRARLRRAAALSLLGFAGIAVAATALLAVHAVRQRAHRGDTRGPAVVGDRSAAVSPREPASPAASSPVAYVRAAERAERKRFNASLMSSPGLPDGELFPLLHVAPAYPPAAAARKLEGFAVGEFTVTADGDVTDVHIVKSTDAVFDAPTIEAIRESKYKPRVVNGEAVPVHGVRLRIGYRLQAPRAGADANKGAAATKRAAAPLRPPEPQDALSRQQFDELLAGTMSCLRANDLNCIELNLDRIRAGSRLTRSQREKLLRIEGFVQHREGNYERAIAAYRKAAELQSADGVQWNTLMIVAHIYYERHEYQPALDAALRYLKRAQHPAPADYVFVDRLRQLGAVVR